MIYHQKMNSISNYNFNAYFYDNLKFDYHFHKNFELIYVISGDIKCTINGKTDILHENEFALCLSNEVHAYQSLTDSKVWIGVFSGDFVHSFEKQTLNKVAEDFKFQCNRYITEYLKKALFYNNALDTYILKSCLYAVCAEYSKNIKLKELKTKNDLFIRTITDYVAIHFADKISLSDLASVSGYDYCYISRYFNKTFNMSFNDFLNSYRLEHALLLLNETNKAITDIAFESGFQSVRSFNHYFKLKLGKTPTQYRKS